MRVLADTNTILSALVFPKSVTAEALRYVFSRHRLVLCAYVVDEARDIVKRKFPSYVDEFERFLYGIDFELVFVPEPGSHEIKVSMRDPKDEPILLTAIIEKVDILLTGDKDFHVLNLANPRIMSPRSFLEEYGDHRPKM